MDVEATTEVMVQVRYASGDWEDFRQFDTKELANDYIRHDGGGTRVVERTVVTIKSDWRVVNE